MDRDNLPDDLVLSEEQFREVIERATQAELSRDGVSIAMLRQIAEELDIDPRALQQALGEVVGPRDRARPVRSWLARVPTSIGRFVNRILPSAHRLPALATLGGALGWLTAHIALGLRVLLDGHSISVGSSGLIDLPVAVLLIVVTFANGLSRRLRGERLRYLAEMLGMWSAFAVVWAVTFGAITNDLVSYVGTAMVGAAVWGFLLIRRGRRGNGVGAAEPDATGRRQGGETPIDALNKSLKAPRELVHAIALRATLAGRWRTAVQPG